MTLYDFASLENLVADRRLDHQNDGMVAAMAEKFGIKRDSIHQYRKRGVNTDTADRLACRAGFHPSAVWETWFEDSIHDECPTCREPIPFKNTSPSPLCARCTRQQRGWERHRNEVLIRTFWERLDGYRETLDFSALDQPTEHTSRVQCGQQISPRETAISGGTANLVKAG